MKEMTKDNLKAAFAGESQASMKYTLFAIRAKRDGYPEAARLFRAIAYAEQVHAGNHLRALGGIASTAENLEAAMGGEHYEVNEMYPAFKSVAELQEEKRALRSFRYAIEAEKIHEVMYRDAKTSVGAGNDIDANEVFVCPVCGHTHFGEPPDKCPVCSALKKKYRQF
jgi:rubrerythrin